MRPSRSVGRRGAVIVWVAIVLVVLIGFVGLAVDYGFAFYTGQQLQNAADAAALAGAHRVWYGHEGARAAAIGIASQNAAAGDAVQLASNPTNSPDGDVVVGIYNSATRTFVASSSPAESNAVRVIARRTSDSPGGALPLFFGGMFGQDDVGVTRWAIAVAEGGPAYSDIIALSPDDPYAFYIHGNAFVTVGEAGSVQVNSSAAPLGSVFQGTSTTLIAGEVNMVSSNFETRGHPGIPPAEDMNSDQPFVSDPLAHLPEPYYDLSMADPRMAITGSGTFTPGYYPNGLTLNSSDQIFLEPGVYILGDGPNGDSKAFEIMGQGQLEGYGVMFYLASGSVHDRGGGEVRVTPPLDGVYQGIQIFQARNNTDPALFNGGSYWGGAATDDPSTPEVDESTAGAGTFYFPDARFQVTGNASQGSSSMMINGLIADTIEFYGTANVHVTSGWDGDQGTERVYLVE